MPNWDLNLTTGIRLNVTIFLYPQGQAWAPLHQHQFYLCSNKLFCQVQEQPAPFELLEQVYSLALLHIIGIERVNIQPRTERVKWKLRQYRVITGILLCSSNAVIVQYWTCQTKKHSSCFLIAPKHLVERVMFLLEVFRVMLHWKYFLWCNTSKKTGFQFKGKSIGSFALAFFKSQFT